MEQNPAGECDSRVGSQISVLHKNWLYITGLTKDRRWSVTSHMNAVYIHRMLMSAVLITLLWRWDHYAVSKRRVPYHRWRGFTCQNNWYLMHIHLFSSLSYDRSKKPLPKRAVHIVRCRASSFKWEYPLLSLRSSSSFLRLLPRLPVTSIPPFIFPSITRCRRQFLRKMWPIQFAFRLRISCRIFLCSLSLSNTCDKIISHLILYFDGSS